MSKQKEKKIHTWGETDQVKRFRSTGNWGVHALTGLKLEKDKKYDIPENQAGKDIFEPVKDKPKGGDASAPTKDKEVK